MRMFHDEQRVMGHTAVSSKTIGSTRSKIIRTENPRNFIRTQVQVCTSEFDESPCSMVRRQSKVQVRYG